MGGFIGQYSRNYILWKFIGVNGFAQSMICLIFPMGNPIVKENCFFLVWGGPQAKPSHLSGKEITSASGIDEKI